MKALAGVVPCSGGSTRMGRHKALMDADGESFVSRVVHALALGGCDPVLVVVREDRGAEAAAARDAGAQVVVNPRPADGPISSIRAAVGSLPDGIQGIVLLPVDHPRVRASTVSTVIRTARSHPDRLVVARFGSRRGHPALFPSGVLDELMDPALEGGARTVVRRDPDRVLEVDVEDPGVLQNINVPEDYEEAFGVRTGEAVG